MPQMWRNLSYVHNVMYLCKKSFIDTTMFSKPYQVEVHEVGWHSVSPPGDWQSNLYHSLSYHVVMYRILVFLPKLTKLHPYGKGPALHSLICWGLRHFDNNVQAASTNMIFGISRFYPDWFERVWTTTKHNEMWPLQIRIKPHVDMRWDSFPISTEASQSGLSDRSHRVSKSGFFAWLAALPQIQRDRSALKWRPAELFGRKTQRAAPKYISCPATWRCDRLESEMMDLFFYLLESRVTTVCSELMSLPQHTHTHTHTYPCR